MHFLAEYHNVRIEGKRGRIVFNGERLAKGVKPAIAVEDRRAGTCAVRSDTPDRHGHDIVDGGHFARHERLTVTDADHKAKMPRERPYSFAQIVT